MIRDRFAIFAVLILVSLAAVLLITVGTGRPPGNVPAMPVKASWSPDNTAADGHVMIINASDAVPEADSSNITSEMSSPHSSPLVLEILRINNISQSYQSDYYNTYDVYVLRSNVTACREGVNYTMQIDEYMDGYYGMVAGIAPKELIPGIIIEIVDYRLANGNLTVAVSADPYNNTAWDNAWKQKITITG